MRIQTNAYALRIVDSSTYIHVYEIQQGKKCAVSNHCKHITENNFLFFFLITIDAREIDWEN